MTGASFHRGSSSGDFETPADFIAAVEARFGKIDFDLAASPENAKARSFFTKEDDALVQNWHAGLGHRWLNPPFDRIAPWAAKCASAAFDADWPISFLVPAAVGSNWFRDYVHEKARVYFLNGRLHFDPKHPTWGYPKDCLLARYGEEPGYEVWAWRNR